MNITASPDISILQVNVTWDIAGLNPIITIDNQSVMTNPANLTWWFLATSPTNSIIHQGDESNPDITGAWTEYVMTDAWPRPFNQIEWSGAPYQLIVYVKDSLGNVYQSPAYVAYICRPAGNTNLSKTTYGLAEVDVQVQCQNAAIFFQDKTYHSYKGIEGERLSSILRVIYPMDETYNIPDPFIGTDFTTALVPITYNSTNYQLVVSSVYKYDFGGGSNVVIKYQKQATFAVLCNIDLCPLVCEVSQLITDIETGNCSDVAEANRKLSLINPKLALCLMGIQQPLCGIDVPKLIEEIKAIGGFTCDCCNAPTGIIPQTSSVIGGYNFVINPVCGDITGTVTTNGQNISFNLQDKSYVFNVYQDSPMQTTAFEVIPSTNGCTKTYSLAVDMTQLATDMAYVIQSNGYLLNLWNSLFNINPSFSLVVDGGCIFSSSSTCDYDFTLLNIPVNTTFAILKSVQIGSNTTNLNYSFNLTNLPGLQSYLNGLGLGTFTVTNPTGQTVLIATTNNANNFVSLVYSISSTSYIANQNRTCTGYVPVPADQVVQNIINYICGLDDAQIATSQSYTICYLDTNGAAQTTTISAGVPLSELLEQLIDLGCQTVSQIQGASAVTCTALKALFPASGTPLTSANYLLGTKGAGNDCAQVNYLDAFKFMLTIGQSDSATKALFCQFVALCGQGLTCAPYNYFNVIVTTYDSTCVPLVGISYTLT